MNRRNRDNLRILLFTLGALLAGLLMFSVTIAKADEPTTLRFGWGYDPAAEALIGGFWLYVNNQQMTTGIPPTARTVEVAYIKDREARRYHLTAFIGSEESAPSAHVDIPAHWTGVPAILGGTLSVQLLDQDGNVIQEINSSVQGTINQ